MDWNATSQPLFGVPVRRPVLALMLNLALLVLGAFAYTRLGIEALPRTEASRITVGVAAPGVGPSVIESQIVIPLEDALAVIEGVSEITSRCNQGQATVFLQFNPDVNLEAALQQARGQVYKVRDKFPSGSLEPTFFRANTSSSPVLQLSVSSEMPPQRLAALVKSTLVEPLKAVEGVANVDVSGERKKQIQVWVDPARLDELRLGVSDVLSALQQRGKEQSAGSLVSDSQKLPVRYSVGSDLGTTLLGRSVPLQELARIEEVPAPATALARLNGQPTFSLSVLKNSEANTLEVISGVKRKLASVKLPDGVRLEIVRDDSTTIQQSYASVWEHLILGTVLACVVVLIFTRSPRSTVIVCLALPVSLVGTFLIFWLMGYTLNVVTLLALNLAAGLVIDDAIVVLENVVAKLEQPGVTPADAAVAGAQEVGFAVVATTLSLVVMFLPLSYMPGGVGKMMGSFGVVMAFSIAVSMAVSFTLTPMLCSKLLRPGQPPPPGWVAGLENLYVGLLRVALRFRPLVLTLCAGVVVLGLLSARGLQTGFVTEDEQDDYSLNLALPPAWTLDRAWTELAPLETRLRALPHVRYVLSTVQSSSAQVYVRLQPWAQRAGYRQSLSLQAARQLLEGYPQFKTTFQGAGQAFQVRLTGPELEPLASLAQRVGAVLAAHPGVQDVSNDLAERLPELQVQVDTALAERLGVQPAHVSQTIQALTQGCIATTLDGKDVLVRLEGASDLDPLLLDRVPLSSVATLTPMVSPAVINRLGGQRVVTLSATLVGMGQNQAFAVVQDALKDSPGYGLAVGGATGQTQQAGSALLTALLLGTTLIYMVLASQFEDLIYPILILTTLPLTIPCALLVLRWTGTELDLFSGLGLFLLLGVVKKNAVLQIDHTEALIRRGLPWREAILQANRERLRPILMTTLTLIMAMLPVALAGPTGQMRAPMGVVVVGGQLLSLLLTLVFVPVCYSYVKQVRGWRS